MPHWSAPADRGIYHVPYQRDTNPYRVKFTRNKKTIHIGYYPTRRLAQAAATNYRTKLKQDTPNGTL